MYHCIKFQADEVYCLEDNEICTNRILSVGFCPVCSKPVAELTEYTFNGGLNKTTVSGLAAQVMMDSLKKSILRPANIRIKKSKPYGWKYGINKESKSGKVMQYACDFYGNKELIKRI